MKKQELEKIKELCGKMKISIAFTLPKETGIAFSWCDIVDVFTTQKEINEFKSDDCDIFETSDSARDYFRNLYANIDEYEKARFIGKLIAKRRLNFWLNAILEGQPIYAEKLETGNGDKQ